MQSPGHASSASTVPPVMGSTLIVMMFRSCSRVGCRREAEATLTYDYADSLVVVGPLALEVEPHSYDLCHRHAEDLSVPQGWTVLRHVGLSYDV